MRPINKGNHPQAHGSPVVFDTYGNARPYLINTIGDYCSYCENQITNLAVEHIQPKSQAPGIALSWNNLILK